ncbi:MAG: leucine-rich repeat domain-containing protein [Ruminococcaceae bacterium]|nr:leucine-rich repeat domain-containing protein [Oscillospiraceae bacterium]
MATLLCDICSGNLVMNSGGQNATCSVCGISYSVERLREKIQTQNIQGGVTVNVVTTPPAAETLEELQFLGKKYLKHCDWENAEKVYEKILDKSPTDEEAFDIFNKLKVWKHMEVENGVLKRYTGRFSEVVLPDAVTSIGNRVFTGNKGVQTVVLTDNVETIEREAFYQSKDLKRVVGLSGVRFIGKNAFFDCLALEECELGNNVEYISDEAFRGCTSLKSIKLAGSLKQLERGVFKGCTSLKEVIIPAGIKVISASLFELCYNLKSVVLPDGIVRIETNAFYGCRALSDINIPSTVEELQTACFKESGISNIDLPEKLEEIPIQCFDRCENLLQIVLPPSVKKICDKAFYGCIALASITFDPSIKVGRQVFFNCRKLIYVNPPEGDGVTTSVVLLDLTNPAQSNGEVLPVELFSALKGTPYYNSEILRRRSNKLCDRCAGKLGMFGKCKVCGYSSKDEKR